MKTFCLLMLLITAGLAFATELPDWARAAVTQAKQMEKPKNAEVWVLLDETRISLRGDGRYRQRRRLLRWVLDGDGKAASVYLVNGDESTTKIKKLKGWHSHGTKVERLDKNNVVTLGAAMNAYLDNNFNTLAMFEDVSVGSILAFESDEIIDSYHSKYVVSLASASPVLSFVCELDDKGRGQAQLTPMGFEGWGLDYTLGPDRLECRNLSPILAGRLLPPFTDVYPTVLIGFTKPGKDDPLNSWGDFARWYNKLFRQKAMPEGWATNGPMASLEEIQHSVDEMQARLTYRQVYLSAARGYEPLAGKEVERLAYGDCKDMVSCLAARLRRLNAQVLPALCGVGNAPRLNSSALPQPAFNHVIAAIALEKSLGLPAEVTVGERRYLLYDPTAKSVPLGYLPDAHADRQLLICGEEDAVWVTVPQKALREGAIKLTLSGSLNQKYTLTGHLMVEEAADQWGLASLRQSSNLEDLMEQVRNILDVPGSVSLTLEKNEVDEKGNLALSFQASWPLFLTIDLGGLRLPYGLFPNKLEQLNYKKQPRVAPVYRANEGHYQLTLDLETEAALKPRLAQAEHKDDHGSFSWKISEGKHLEASLTLDADAVFYPKDQLAQAEAWYQPWRNAYNAFLTSGPVLTQTKPVPP